MQTEEMEARVPNFGAGNIFKAMIYPKQVVHQQIKSLRPSTKK